MYSNLPRPDTFIFPDTITIESECINIIQKIPLLFNSLLKIN